MITVKEFKIILLIYSISSFVSHLESRSLYERRKRSFANLGCLGDSDKEKFARLSLICEECYHLYREQDLHKRCREYCFRNEIFSRCIDALLLSQEKNKLVKMVDDLDG